MAPERDRAAWGAWASESLSASRAASGGTGGSPGGLAPRTLFFATGTLPRPRRALVGHLHPTQAASLGGAISAFPLLSL